MMAKILPAKYRYPIFFAGVMLMSVAGFVHEVVGRVPAITATLVALGFVLFTASFAIP